MRPGEASVAVHQAKVVVRLVVAAADWYEVIRARSDARTPRLAVLAYFAFASGSAYHRAALIC